MNILIIIVWLPIVIMEDLDSGIMPCLDRKELDNCVNNCNEPKNSDCQRQANLLLNCEDKCRESCKIIQASLNDKCVIHLMAHVNFLRSTIRNKDGN